MDMYSPVYDVINLEINLSFHINPFSYTTKKSGQKFKYFSKEQRKAFSSFLKGFIETNETNFFWKARARL